MTALSKAVFDELVRDARCEDFIHPWTSNCLKGVFDFTTNAFLGSAKFSLLLYTVQVLYKGRNLTEKQLRNIFEQFMRLSLFGTSLCLIYMSLTCLQRKLLGRFEYYSFVFLPSAIAGGAAMFVMPAWRWYPIIATFTNSALETVLMLMDAQNICKKSLTREMALFMLSNAGLFYFIRLWPKNIIDKPLPEFWFFYPPAVKSSISNPALQNNLEEETTHMKQPNRCCPHSELCIVDICKSTWNYFSCGLALGVLRSLVSNINKPGLFSKYIFVRRNVNLGAFLGTYVMLAKATNCLLCRVMGFDSEYYALPAGLISGLSYYFQPNITVCLAAFCFLVSIAWSYYDVNKLVFKGFRFQLILLMLANGFLFHITTFDKKHSSKFYVNMLYVASNGRSEQMYRSFMEYINQNLKRL